MLLGKVIGNVVATKKEENLQSRRLLVVRILDERLRATKKECACVDSVAAKPGDVVMVCGSSSSRLAQAARGTCTDMAIVGIVSRISSSGKDWYVYGG